MYYTGVVKPPSVETFCLSLETTLSDGSQLLSRFYHPMLRGDFRQDWEAVIVSG